MPERKIKSYGQAICSGCGTVKFEIYLYDENETTDRLQARCARCNRVWSNATTWTPSTRGVWQDVEGDKAVGSAKDV